MVKPLKFKHAIFTSFGAWGELPGGVGERHQNVSRGPVVSPSEAQAPIGRRASEFYHAAISDLFFMVYCYATHAVSLYTSASNRHFISSSTCEWSFRVWAISSLIA